MIPQWEAVLQEAYGWLVPGGELHIVDFGRQEKLPRAFRTGLRAWLRLFHSEALHRDFVAQVRAIKHIEVRAMERGYLQSVFVDEGQALKSGQRMFQILPLVYQAEVNTPPSRLSGGIAQL